MSTHLKYRGLTILPSYRYYGKIPCGKLAEVKDIAHAAVFLASEEAKMVNCHTLCVDGGWTVW